MTKRGGNTEQDPEGWTCIRCGIQNPDWTDTCRNCGAPRPFPSVRPVRTESRMTHAAIGPVREITTGNEVLPPVPAEYTTVEVYRPWSATELMANREKAPDPLQNSVPFLEYIEHVAKSFKCTYQDLDTLCSMCFPRGAWDMAKVSFGPELEQVRQAYGAQRVPYEETLQSGATFLNGLTKWANQRIRENPVSLSDIRQKPQQTVELFYGELQTAFRHMGHNLAEQGMITYFSDCFVKGLRAQIRDGLESSLPDWRVATPMTLLQKAKGVESNLALKQSTAKVRLTEVAEAPPAPRRGACFNCGEEGHYRNDCPQPQKPQHKQEGGNQGGGRGGRRQQVQTRPDSSDPAYAVAPAAR
ncbi:hypothetical protein GDO81_013660 [Engystomops pustulosus]|uniref:Gag protein n=1 Tax=Engystomops pustulosus TaxID=76066 RepID=A0AAV7B4Q1_ENGPU|nr:hypothetical protein GDO81_013660 [Engystomops pustulosus]